MSILLIDIGNSRIKWFFDTSATPITANTKPHAVSHHQEDWLTILAHDWQTQIAPLECRISNVAHESVFNAVLSLLSQIYPKLSIQKITPQAKHAGLKLTYDITQMGADRYAQLLGAQTIAKGQDHLVISAGTATTIDGVQADGQHVGGIILPSMDLMRKSLHQYTAKLPLAGGNVHPKQSPHNTLDALANGTHLATIGAVQAFMMRYMKHQGKDCAIVLCGGNAHLIATDLPSTRVYLAPALCLLGLKSYAPSNQ